MKLLLDENLPHRLRPLIVGHDVYTVSFMKWNGVANGRLLALAAADGFHAIITKDTGMPYEQNTVDLPCSLVILEAPTNELDDILPLLPMLLLELERLPAKSMVRIHA